MKKTDVKMVPGGIIEWAYKSSNKVVNEDEELWSTLMKQWVPIGSKLIHILVSIDGKKITWLNEKGCFHARVNDTGLTDHTGRLFGVLPRACG